jgi:hypothetical protein
VGSGQPFADQGPFDAFATRTAGGPPATDTRFTAPAPAAPSPGQPAYGQPDFGQSTYGQPTYGQPAPGQPIPRQPGGEAEQPVPQIRNGRVLLAVLCAAVLLLVVPLGIVWLATRSSAPSFDVGSCVSKSGSEAVAADCSADGAFTVVSKVDNQSKCTNPPGQPYVVVADGGRENVLCLRPAAGR